MKFLRSLTPINSTTAAVAAGIYSLSVVLLAMVGAILFAFRSGLATDAPSYALSSPLVLLVEQTAVISALLIAPAILAAYLLAGRLPQSISASGVEWGEERDAVLTVVRKLESAQRKDQQEVQGLIEAIRLLRLKIDA